MVKKKYERPKLVAVPDPEERPEAIVRTVDDAKDQVAMVTDVISYLEAESGIDLGELRIPDLLDAMASFGYVLERQPGELGTRAYLISLTEGDGE